MLEKQTTTPFIQWMLTACVVMYMVILAFESPIRYGLNLVGADSFIYIRELITAMVIAYIFMWQLFRRQVHHAFIFYFFIVFFHGAVMILNFGSYQAVFFMAKILMFMLLGALASDILFKPTRRMLYFFAALWTITVIGVFLHKYDLITLPWSGMTTKFGDIEVEINRDWTMATGYNKRASGLLRSSISAAAFLPPLAFILLFNVRHMAIRFLVAIVTIVVIYWTTQKGALLSFALVVAIMAFSFSRFILVIRLWFLFLLVAVTVLPLVLPGYVMPQASGQFSMMSFYGRIEEMWPASWHWLSHYGVFPFGIGLGGIGSPLRLYGNELFPSRHAADNLFIYVYLNCGVLTFVYFGWITAQLFRLRNAAPAPAAHVIALLSYLMGYGIFVTIIEDPTSLLVIGGALACLEREVRLRNKVEKKTAMGPRLNNDLERGIHVAQ